MANVTRRRERDQAENRYCSFVHTEPASKRSLRRIALRSSAAGLMLVMALAAVPAFADTPEAWQDEPAVSGLEFLLVLFLIPLGLALVVGLLAAIPSMLSRDDYEPGHAWRGETTWFGGPRKGLEADEGPNEKELSSSNEQTGGASARW